LKAQPLPEHYYKGNGCAWYLVSNENVFGKSNLVLITVVYECDEYGTVGDTARSRQVASD